MEELLADLLFAASIWRRAEVVGQMPDGAEVSFLGALAEAGQSKILQHPLTEIRGLATSRGHLKVLSQSGKETPLRRSLYQGTATRQRLADRRESP
jgi:hypothetical protein